MTSLIGRFFAWLERGIRGAQRREVEGYLSQAVDTADLERRIRMLERR
jgi:hypothetical protein